MRAFFLSIPLLLVAAAVADDGVKPKGSSIVYRGEIVRYDERGLTLKWGPRQELKEFAPDQIDRIETKWPDGFDAGKAALAKGRFTEATVDLQRSLREEKRPWAQDMIKGLLLRALDGQGDSDAAAEVFVDLVPNRSDAAIMAYAPFRWTKGSPSEQRLTAARAWLRQNDHSVVSLLAANWLIDVEKERATAALQKLVTDPDSRVRPIARALLLRERLRKNPKSITKDELTEFRGEVERLSPPVRFGPQYVLALAYEANGDPVEAALAFLYVPYVTSGPPDLQAECLERAAAACERAGLKGDSAKLRAELQQRFPASAAAKRTKSAGRPASKS
jgi:hypothetical protein